MLERYPFPHSTVPQTRGPYAIGSFTRTIQDDPVKGTTWFKPCKDTMVSDDVIVGEPVYLGNPFWDRTNYPDLEGWIQPVFSISHPTLDSHGGLYADYALRQMLPSASEGANLMVALVELRELRSTVVSLTKRWRNITDANSAFLAYQFGLKPVINDIKKFIKNLISFRDRLRWLKRQQGKVLKRQYRRDISDAASSLEDDTEVLSMYAATGGFYGPNDDLIRYRRRRWETRPIYSATLIYRFRMDRDGEIEEKIGYFLDRFGLNITPSTVWSLIPFSFIVDWFLDIGGFLRNFEPNNLGIVTEVLDFCHSIKVQAVEYTSLSYANYAGEQLPERLTRETRISYYDRRQGFPSLMPIQQGPLSAWRTALGTSVLGSQVTTPRRRPGVLRFARTG